jgi:hypothetical protein
MLIIYLSGPVAGKSVFQLFRFANTLKRAAFGFFNEGVDAVENFLIGFFQ